MNRKCLVVIGGGAAGFFCAVNAARLNPSLRVIILEKSNKLLSKVRISGGGRCNVTHACFDIEEMIRQYPRGMHFVKKAFHQFFTRDTIEWFRQRGVLLKTEPDGRMFPITDSSQTIIDCLLKEATQHHVEIRMMSEVKNIARLKDSFEISVSNSEALSADYVCIAAGGFSKSLMFEWITATGHTFEPPVPSLFTFNMPGNPITELMGISVEAAQVKVTGAGLVEKGPLLITHWGMSGPVILRLSAWGARELAALKYHFTITVNWLVGLNETQLRDTFHQLRSGRGAQKISSHSVFNLPQRLWKFLLQQSDIDEQVRWGELTNPQQNALLKNLSRHEFDVKGKTTFKEEFVTAGGIKLREIEPHTMESKKLKGLFFAGEVMDVDGITGGFNFQHAWTSGFVAADAVARKAAAT